MSHLIKFLEHELEYRTENYSEHYTNEARTALEEARALVGPDPNVTIPYLLRIILEIREASGVGNYVPMHKLPEAIRERMKKLEDGK